MSGRRKFGNGLCNGCNGCNGCQEEGRRKKEESPSTSRSGNKKSEERGNRPNWFGPLRTSIASGAVAISAPVFRSSVMGTASVSSCELEVTSWK